MALQSVNSVALTNAVSSALALCANVGGPNKKHVKARWFSEFQFTWLIVPSDKHMQVNPSFGEFIYKLFGVHMNSSYPLKVISDEKRKQLLGIYERRRRAQEPATVEQPAPDDSFT
ncbi:hypothetical protein T265_04243 [Opisthorchis viverrini]|uniref:Uncharacterized protein n=1 Tax=Opisthorchis viverrini TaxID=6198 RepID=A0A074ZT96_OPIVI|nr:hypothetical protein T265_04243 [Opisthorchis viverrini]KER29057.1 hypothetical protein T265_04243 [Opisthorchis viverrini]